MKRLSFLLAPPCPKCSYTQGMVQLIESPCPSCKLNGYSMYDILAHGKYKRGEVKKAQAYRIRDIWGKK